MTQQIEIPIGAAVLAELEEFGGFLGETQRYIRRSLDIALARSDPVARWARSQREATEIRAQIQVYGWLGSIRRLVPTGSALGEIGPFFTPLVAVSDFDIGTGHLTSFSAYRFLYERMLGAKARPWLASAFCAAAAMPHQELSGTKLIASLGDAVDAPWSSHEATFYPEWIDS